MEQNGTIFCDHDECHLEIKRYDLRIALPRPQIVGKGTDQKYSHYHNRHKGDCWSKVKAASESRKTAAIMGSAHDAGTYRVGSRKIFRDLDEYNQFLVQQGIRRVI